jgi:triacylglycerol lipase
MNATVLSACGLLVVAASLSLRVPAAAAQPSAMTDAQIQKSRGPGSSNTRAAASLLAAAATGPRTSLWDPPEASDKNFIIDASPSLDTGCTFRGGGPFTFDIAITRFVGELNSDGTLKNAAALKAANLISPEATLIMPAFDVDSNANVSGFAPERDRVSVNGQEVGFLSGEDNVWKLNSFKIPIEKVKFSARGANGASPAGGINQIRIDIDTANTSEVWCTSLDWAASSFKAMSPIILIHGNNSNGAFFDAHGFTATLRDNLLVHDNSITMSTDTVKNHGAELDRLIPSIVKSFGVDSVHLIVHSKGGLDAREYLASKQPSHDDQFKVLSFTSLSSPHNGSVGADVLVTRANALKVASEIEFAGFPSHADDVIAGMSVDAGTPDLTTDAAASFNASNLSRLSSSTTFHTIAADADTNNNQKIDRSPDEYLELRRDSPQLTALDNEFFGQTKTRIAIDTVYQTLRTLKSVSVAYRTETSFFTRRTKTIATITGAPLAAPAPNDVLVTTNSGHGFGSLASRVTKRFTFNGAQGRNHSSVANSGVALTVIPWIVDAEKSRGDLK